MLKAIRQDQEETRVFQAGIQGIDLTKHKVDAIEEKRREIERRANEKMHGFAAVERQEFEEFGIVFE
jgi:hypothetical protein